MAGYVRGSKAYLDKLVEGITESCDNIKKRSPESEEDVQRIMDNLTSIYLDYGVKDATKRKRGINEIDIPDFMK